MILYAVRVSPLNWRSVDVHRFEVVSESLNFYIVTNSKGARLTLLKGQRWVFFTTELLAWKWLQNKLRDRIARLKERKNEVDSIIDEMTEEEFMKS